MTRLFTQILFLNLAVTICYSQATYFKGKVKDKQTLEPISDVHIYDCNGVLRAVSNYYGDFQLSFVKDTSTFKTSYIGYKSIKFALFELNQDPLVLLPKDTIRLKEIIIKPLSASEIIANCIMNIDSLYLKDDINTTGKFNFIIEQGDSLVFEISNPFVNISMENPGFYPISSELTNLSLHNNSDDIVLTIFGDLNKEIKNIFLFDHIIRKRGFLNMNNIDAWNFEIENYTAINNLNLMVIKANFIDHSNKLNHSARIFVNEEDYGIVKIDFSYNWGNDNYKKTNVDSLWMTEFSWNGRANYIIQHGVYTLSNLEYSSSKRISTKNLLNLYAILFEYKIVSNYTSKNLVVKF